MNHQLYTAFAFILAATKVDAFIPSSTHCNPSKHKHRQLRVLTLMLQYYMPLSLLVAPLIMR